MTEPTPEDDVMPRPYFVPGLTNWDELSLDMKIAFQCLVYPAYQEMVLKAASVLEATTASTYVFLLAEKVQAEIALGHTMDIGLQLGSPPAVDRARQVESYLRLLASMQEAADYLLKIKTLRNRQGSLTPANQRI